MEIKRTTRGIPYNELNRKEYHKTKLEIADHASSLLFGQGYNVNILKHDGGKWNQAEDILDQWEKIERENEFAKFLLKNEYNLSYYGHTIITIDKLANSRIRLGIANPEYFNQLGVINIVDDVAALIFRNIKKDRHNFVVKEIWDREKVVREVFAGGGTLSAINLDTFNKDIPQELQIKKTEYHRSGVLPVLQILNKQRDINHIGEFIELSDAYNVEGLIDLLQSMRAEQTRELLLNHTRVFGNFSQRDFNKMEQTQGATTALLLKDLLVHVNTKGDAQNSKLVEVAPGNPQLQTYSEAINDLLKHIWRGAGYTYIQSGDTMSGNAETLYANSADIRTTKTKRTIRQEDYAKLIKKILIISGAIKLSQADDIKVVFNIKENIVQSPAQVVDSYLRLQEAGIISKARVIQKIEQLTQLDEAQALVKEAEQEQEHQLKANVQALQGQEPEPTINNEDPEYQEPKGTI